MPKNALEALLKLVHSLADEEPKPNLHIGEAMSCWTYLAMLAEAVSFEEIGLNTTKDPELCDVVEKSREGAASQAERLEEFMRKEGVALPPVSESKPHSNPDSIPPGVKMTDDEIANAVAIKLASAITFCATAAAQTVRNDVGMMFFEFQTEAMKYGTLLKSVMKKRGWLKYPPDYVPPGLPNSQPE